MLALTATNSPVTRHTQGKRPECVAEGWDLVAHELNLARVRGRQQRKGVESRGHKMVRDHGTSGNFFSIDK